MVEFTTICIFGDSSDQSVEETFRNADILGTQRVILSNLRLPSINPSMSTLVNLTHLTLSFNRLTQITNIEELQYLRYLDVSHNKILSLEGIPSSIQTLRCNNNEIENLTPIRKLASLSELWISNNKIGWLEFVNIIGLKSLSVIIKSANICDEKLKLLDFLLAISPSLKIVDGSTCVRELQSSEFLLSADGRLMLNQARPQMTVDQKKSLEAIRKTAVTSTAANAANANNSNNNEPPTTTVASKRDKSHSVSGAGSDIRVEGGGQGGAQGEGGLTVVASPRSPRYDGAPPSSSARVGVTVIDSPTPTPTPSKRVEKKGHRSQLPKKFISEASEGSGGSSSGSGSGGGGGGSAQQDISLITRYGGDTDDCAVALCLYGDNSGYVRWAKGGPVACSIENGRMFASFRGGSIACILDAAGSGSVMDSRGRCLLLLSERGTAKVLNKVGAMVVEYDRSECCTGSGTSAAERSVEESEEGKGGGAGVGVGADTGPSKLHRWKSEGMQIDFIPSQWELRVRVMSDRVIVDFSSISGGKLVKDLMENKPVAAKKATRQTAPNLTDSEHESLRSGLQSIMSGLDDVMANIKKV